MDNCQPAGPPMPRITKGYSIDNMNVNTLRNACRRSRTWSSPSTASSALHDVAYILKIENSKLLRL
eukprot:3807224-Pleurochrysis_carterae.AAC.2